MSQEVGAENHFKYCTLLNKGSKVNFEVVKTDILGKNYGWLKCMTKVFFNVHEKNRKAWLILVM